MRDEDLRGIVHPKPEAMQFRDRAEELRTMAEQCKVPMNMQLLKNMADNFEQIARQIETDLELTI